MVLLLLLSVYQTLLGKKLLRYRHLSYHQWRQKQQIKLLLGFPFLLYVNQHLFATALCEGALSVFYTWVRPFCYHFCSTASTSLNRLKKREFFIMDLSADSISTEAYWAVDWQLLLNSVSATLLRWSIQTNSISSHATHWPWR